LSHKSRKRRYKTAANIRNCMGFKKNDEKTEKTNFAIYFLLLKKWQKAK
jgi:hypothetical protein